MQNTKSRAWCLTLNNYTDEEYNDILEMVGYRYMIVGKEVGENGTPHLQMYMYWNNVKAFGAMKKLIPRAHIEKARGNARENRDYCSKDGDFIELGDIPSQGKRKDLEELKDEVMKGKRVNEIVEESPMSYHQYGRTLEKLESLRLNKKFRTEKTDCIWYWGKSGVGKSHKAFEGYKPETHYVWRDDGGWWDWYDQQDTVIINEFRGQIKYGELLELTDKWPYSVRRRNKPPMQFTSKLIIITSSMPPKEVYDGISYRDSLDQLLRRIKVIEVLSDEVRDFVTEVTEVPKGNTVL